MRVLEEVIKIDNHYGDVHLLELGKKWEKEIGNKFNRGSCNLRSNKTKKWKIERKWKISVALILQKFTNIRSWNPPTEMPETRNISISMSVTKEL